VVHPVAFVFKFLLFLLLTLRWWIIHHIRHWV